MQPCSYPLSINSETVRQRLDRVRAYYKLLNLLFEVAKKKSCKFEGVLVLLCCIHM
ncbi:hypothetical protein Sjap_025745 [Stephania japonica]|uniref:Uncharacterized protein n=1 Tax=Stephania japonica TaxID=461633 RepID=A0AAP0HFX1_9MAGN